MEGRAGAERKLLESHGLFTRTCGGESLELSGLHGKDGELGVPDAAN